MGVSFASIRRPIGRPPVGILFKGKPRGAVWTELTSDPKYTFFDAYTNTGCRNRRELHGYQPTRKRQRRIRCLLGTLQHVRQLKRCPLASDSLSAVGWASGKGGKGTKGYEPTAQRLVAADRSSGANGRW